MRTLEIFLSTDGRLDRERWLGAVTFLLLSMALVWIMTWMLHRHGLVSAMSRDKARLFVMAALAVMWVILDWKRFHDRGLMGACALACPGMHVASRLIEMPQIAAIIPADEFVLLYVGCAQLGVAVWYGIDLAWLEGTQGGNAYGADPRGPPAQAAGHQQPVINACGS